VFCCCIHRGCWLSSIIDFDRFFPLAETENVVLMTTKLTLSPKKDLGNLKIDANAATLISGAEADSCCFGQMVPRSRLCCENHSTTGNLMSAYEKSNRRKVD
jgi:hypothetical protein